MGPMFCVDFTSMVFLLYQALLFCGIVSCFYSVLLSFFQKPIVACINCHAFKNEPRPFRVLLLFSSAPVYLTNI